MLMRRRIIGDDGNDYDDGATMMTAMTMMIPKGYNGTYDDDHQNEDNEKKELRRW